MTAEEAQALLDGDVEIRGAHWAAIDALIVAAEKAERARCVAILKDLGHYELAQRIDGE